VSGETSYNPTAHGFFLVFALVIALKQKSATYLFVCYEFGTEEQKTTEEFCVLQIEVAPPVETSTLIGFGSV